MPNSTSLTKIPRVTLSRQKGVATLFITTMMMFGVTLIVLHSSRLGILELFVSASNESRQTAFNDSESGLDALYAMSSKVIDLNDPAGHTYCTSNFTGCDEVISAATLTADWPAEFESTTNQASLTYEGSGCPPRAFETSCDHLRIANFGLRSVFNDTANKGGTAETVVGVARLLPKFGL